MNPHQWRWFRDCGILASAGCHMIGIATGHRDNEWMEEGDDEREQPLIVRIVRHAVCLRRCRWFVRAQARLAYFTLPH